MEEKKLIKVSLGTVICLFIIVLLIIGLVGMYLYYNKNNSNIIVGNDSEVKINEIGEKEVYKTSDFESIYKSLIDSEYSNVKSFITSDNKIKEIRVSGITIYTEDYLNATGIQLTENISENDVIGSCVFTVEFENVEGLALAGSKGDIHAIVGNCLTDQKDFIFNKDTNKIELCTSLYQKENTISQEETQKPESTISEFELVYNAIQNTNNNNIKNYYSNGKIEKITVNSINIWEDNEYAKALNIEIPQEYKNENIVIGNCEYTVEFQNINEVEFAGSKGTISETVGNSYVDDKLFVYDKTTNKLEFCTSLNF